MNSKPKVLSKSTYSRLRLEELESRVVPAGAFNTVANGLNQALIGELNTVIGDFSQEQASLPILGQSLATLVNQLGSVKGSLKNVISTYEASIQTAIGSLNPNSTEPTVLQALSGPNKVFSTLSAPVYDPVHGNVTFTGHIDKQLTLTSIPFHFNLGLPGVPFSLSTQLNVNLGIDYGDVSFGVQNGNFFLQSAGDVNNPTKLTLTLTADAAKLKMSGTLGFFSITGTPPVGVQSPTHLSVGLAMNANGTSLSNPQFFGNAAVDIHLDAALSSGQNLTLPHIETDFVMNWNLGGVFDVGSESNLGTAPTVEFQNVKFGLGSFLGSMVKPIANLIDEITEPLAPVYQLMQTPLPGLSNLANLAGLPPITLDTLAAAAVNLDVLPPDYQLLAELGLRLHSLVEIIRSTSFGPNNDALIPMGSFNLSNSGDLRTSTLLNGEAFANWLSNPADIGNLTSLLPVAIDATSSVEDRIKNDIASLGLPTALQNQVSQVFNHIDEQLLDAENGFGLTFPLLDDPLSVYKLLLGQDVDFVSFDAKFNGQATETQTIPIWGPVQAGFTGTINFGMELHAGVDTYGVRNFLISVLKGHPNPSVLDQSFYVISDPNEPLVSMNGSITAEAGPKLTFGIPDGADVYAEATFNGSVGTNGPLTVKFVGPNTPENKLRPIGLGGPLFVVQGKITASLSFSVSAGIEILGHVVGEKTVFSLPLASKTLFNTASSISVANPISQSPPANNSVDVIFDAHLYDGEPNGNLLYVEVDNGNVNFIYNGVLAASYALSSIHSITIFGTDENTDFSVSGNFGGNVPIQINAGDSGNNLLFVDDQAYSGPSTTYYSVHDSHIERQSLITIIGLPILVPTTVINFQNMQFVNLNAASASNDVITIYNLLTQTSIVGGNQSNKYLLGGLNMSLDRIFNYLEIAGSQGFDQIIVNDESSTNRTLYSVSDDQVDWTRVVTFTSPFLNNGVEEYHSSEYHFVFRNIDDVEIDAGSGGNSFSIDDVPGTDDINPTAMTIVLDTGTGNDNLTAAATTGPLLIHGQGGSDVVNIGVPQRGTQDISGRVFVDNNGPALKHSGTTLNINDAGDTTVRTVTFSTNPDGQGTIDGFVGTHTYPNPFAPGQSTTTIAYQSSNIAAVNVQGSNEVNTFNVLDTPRSPGSLLGGLLANHISTNLTLGTFLNTVQVSGTTGPLNIAGSNALSAVYLGGIAGSPGNLAKLAGPVTVSGSLFELTIDNRQNNGFGYYTMNAASFTAGSSGGIFYPNLNLTDLDVVLGNGGNQVVVNGTPTIPNDEGAGVSISTGNGSDVVQVNGSSAILDVFLGAGAFQNVSIGSNKASLDGIDDVFTTGSGTIQSFISDAAAATGQTFNISSIPGDGNIQRVTRTQFQGDTTATLNTFTFNFQNQSQLYLTAGKGGDQFYVRGTPANMTTIIYGGAGQDSVAIATDDLTPPVLGPVDFYANTKGDNANFFAEDTNTPAQSYIFQATASKPFSQPHVLDQQLVLIGRDAPITFRGITTLSDNLPSIGGNFVSIQGVPSGESLNVLDANNDKVIFGNAISSPIGLMDDIFGTTSISAFDKDVSITLDDSIDSIGRHVVLHPHQDDGLGDFITGMSPGALYLSIEEGSPVHLLGGLGNDTFSMLNTDFVADFSIDGGKGTNTLDDSNVLLQGGGGNDTFSTAAGVYVNLKTGEASGLLGGISRIQNVTGSAFDDILVGNGGSILNGGAGRDLLIAGATHSTLQGGSGDDILIGGTTADDTSHAQLTAVLAAWADYLNTSLLDGHVTGNGGKNTLYGQSDTDLFFVGKGDTNQIDNQKGEVIDSV